MNGSVLDVERLSDLSRRDVICVHDGRRLGFVMDLEIDVRTGKIAALIVPGEPRWFGLFGRGDDLIIGWHQVVKIGADVILVECPTHRRQWRHADGRKGDWAGE